MKRLFATASLVAVAAAVGVAYSQTGGSTPSGGSGSGPTAPRTLAPFGKSPLAPALSVAAPMADPSLIPAPKLTPAAADGKPSEASKSSSTGGPQVHIPHGLVTLIGDVRVPAGETGALIEVKVKEGDVVEKGDVLAIIDNRDTLAKQSMAEGELEVARTQADSSAELEAAIKGAEVAKAEWDQLEDIRKKNPGAVSLQEVRRAKFQYERALAQIKVAETDRQVAKLTISVKQAQLDATRHELARREIVSPFRGEIVEIYKKQGEWMQPGEGLMRIISMDKLYVEGFVRADQASAGGLKGKAVSVKVQVYDPSKAETVEHNVKGFINYASPVVEGSGKSRQFRVRAEIENTLADGKWEIQPGSSAEMTIDLNRAAPIRAASGGSASSTLPTSTDIRTPRTDRSGSPAGGETTRPSSSLPRFSAPTGPKVESLKPVTPAPAPVEATDGDNRERSDDNSTAEPIKRRSPRPF